MSNELPDPELEALRERVKENPADLQLQFELGEALFRRGQFMEALASLQRARMLPQRRRQVMECMAECYRMSGRVDLAAEMERAIDFEFPDDEKGLGGAGVPARPKPISPRDSAAVKKLPPDEEEDA